MTQLTDMGLKKLKPDHPRTKMFDGDGLFLDVKPAGPRSPKGSRTWRLKYYFLGTEKLLTFGAYPDVSLKLARELRGKAKALIAQGIDPSADRKARAAAHKGAHQNSFENVAREWFEMHGGSLRDSTREKAIALMEKWVYPRLRDRPIAEITANELYEKVLKAIVKEEKLETAHRVKQRCGRIFNFAVFTGRAQGNPAGSMRDALRTAKVRNHPAIVKPDEVGQLMRSISEFKGQHVTQCALRLSPHLFVRPGELRRAEWKEIDFENAVWSIPAEKMKMDLAHLVPLSRQAIEIFRNLHQLTGAGKYCFPGTHSRDRPMSENTVNVALRRLGYTGEEMVAHGFRTTASTNLNEQGWRYDVIERQLAHIERSDSRRPYNKAEYLKERREMMQAWSDYLDALRASTDSVGTSAAITALFAAARESATPRTT